MAKYGRQQERKGIKLDIDSLTDILPLLGIGGVEESGVDSAVDASSTLETVASTQSATESITDAAQQGNLFTDVVQGVKDFSGFVQEVQNFIPNKSLQLLDDLTKRNTPAQQLNNMFSDIRISAPALSRLSEQQVSPFQMEEERSTLNDFFSLMRQMARR